MSGNSFLLLGPPGTGKSTAAASIINVPGVEKVLVLGTKPRELNSYAYDDPRFVKEIYQDARWRPSLELYEADAFIRLMKRLLGLYSDNEYDAVIIDAGTDAYESASRELLKGEKAATPRDMKDSMSFYGALGYKAKELTQTITSLQFATPRPKHVIMTMHTQPAKDDQERKGQVFESADNKGQGVEFEGNVMAAIEGRHRRTIAGEFDAVLFADIRTEKKIVSGKLQETTSYVLQVRPDSERHAKIALGPMLAEKEIPNDLGVLFKMLTGGAK